ncbi:DNA primase large subunit [Hortaea werneckii]|nr:DNA primase large subunit [Hortaea werneckii]
MLAATSTPRLDPKRRNVLDSRKRQFAKPAFAEQTYPHRLNFYNVPPTGDISLEEFEEWGIARLKVLGELEACHFRNRSPAETEEYMRPVIDKHLRLSSNMSRSSDMEMERKRDHYSHWTLRLAFSGTKDLRERFARLETQLFKLRLQHDDTRERKEFIESLPMAWEVVGEDEKRMYMDELKAATRCGRDDEEAWFKVDWEKVPELVERRQVLLKRGSAFVHVREQMSIVTNEFARNVEIGLELAARFLPRMDEDNRLAPILHHLSQSFVAPDAGYSEASSIGDISTPTAASIDGLSQHFPLCMQNLHKTLRANNHLKHFGRLQYTLFLKGIGLSLQECIIFWRKSFKNFTDEKFKSEYQYNIRHAYGDVGGDANRRGRGYTPYSCQKLLTEAPPSGGQTHGCPYRTYSPDNLIGLLQNVGVNDRTLLRDVRDDVSNGKTRYHIACNRVFEHAHKAQLKKVKDENLWPASELDTILHPNTYFKRSFLLKNLGKVQSGDIGVDGPTQMKTDE